MGFGILFIGYFLLGIGSITPFSVYSSFLGAGVIMFSLKKLIEENKMFFVALICSGALEIVSIVVAFLEIFSFNAGMIYTVLVSIQVYLIPVLTVILLIGMYLLAKSVGLPKLQTKAIINIAVVVLCVTANVIFAVLNDGSAKRIAFFVGLIIQFLYIIFMLYVIFNCYARICYDDDVNMEKQSTGIAPLDFLNKHLNKAMEKKNKIDKSIDEEEKDKGKEEDESK